MCLLRAGHDRYSAKYDWWLWYDQNIELNGHSIIHCNKNTGCLCQSTSIHMDWSCVYWCRNDHRYSAKYNRWLWYDQNTEPNGNSTLHSNKDTGCVCQSTSIHMVRSCVHWCRNGHRYSASTTGGCDTIRTLTLTVSSTTHSNKDTGCVCQSTSIHLVWSCVYWCRNDHRYSASTTGGCDTIRTLNLTVTPLLTVTRDTGCMCQSTPIHLVWSCVHWSRHNHRYGASTTGGCDTIRTLTLTVTPLLTVTRTLDVCANQLPYTWFGHVFTGAGTMIDTVQVQPVVVIQSEHWTWL